MECLGFEIFGVLNLLLLIVLVGVYVSVFECVDVRYFCLFDILYMSFCSGIYKFFYDSNYYILVDVFCKF